MGQANKRAFKVQQFSNGPGRRIGFMATSLEDLRKKISKAFAVGHDFVLALETDGTQVADEDYFASLPSQTAFVVTDGRNQWKGCSMYLKLAMDKIAKVAASTSRDILTEVEEHLCGADSPDMLLMMEYVASLRSNYDAESREDDPEWFEGLPSRISSKDEAMKGLARSRIRGYMSKAREHIDNADDISPKERVLLDRVIELFREELKEKRYFEAYFSRQEDNGCALCDNRGWFSCNGRYNEKGCKQRHVINPYGTRDSRVLFSTWNLDHRIEKSREILPALVIASRRVPKGKAIDWRYFFDLLFTQTNLSLVDVRCHLKERHEGFECDTRRFYIKQKR